MSGGPTLRVLATLETIAREAVEEFVALASRGTRESPRRVLLSGGTTPEPFYHALAAEPTRSRIDWSAVELYFGDERPVPPDHPDSNYGVVRRVLLEPLGLAAPRAYRIRGESSDLDLAAMRYDALVRSRFGAYAPRDPEFDLEFLGLGGDGHTASIFPGVSMPEDSPRLFAAVDVESIGSRRVTATYRLLNAARRAIFLVSGPEKARALQRTLAPEPGTDATPASRVRAVEETVFLVDPEAASALPRAALR